MSNSIHSWIRHCNHRSDERLLVVRYWQEGVDAEHELEGFLQHHIPFIRMHTLNKNSNILDTFLTWGVRTQRALVGFFPSMNGFLVANQRILLTETPIALITLSNEWNNYLSIEIDYVIFLKLSNLVRPLACMNSLMSSTETRLIEFHRAVRASETWFSNNFVVFTFFLARQDRIHLFNKSVVKGLNKIFLQFRYLLMISRMLL